MYINKKTIFILIVIIAIGLSVWFVYPRRQIPTTFTVSNTPLKGPIVKTSTNPELGTYLTDQNRLTLYVSMGQCTGECLTDWVPYRVNPDIPLKSNDPLLKKIGTIKTGTISNSEDMYQYTYLGRELYYYRYDRSPGEVNGHNIANGEWAAIINP